MAGRILRKNVLIAVPLLFMFLTISGPAGKTVRAQETRQRGASENEVQPPEGKDSDEQEAPAPANQTAPQTPPAQPAPPAAGQVAPQAPPAGRAPPPVATPEQRLAPPPAVSRGELVSLNFNRADLIEVIHVLAQHLRITYTIDPDVKGTVTINSAEPLKKEDLFPVFHQILRMNGAVAVKTGDTIYRIAPIEKGKGIARPAGADMEGGYAIQVVPVRFFSVSEMKRLLVPFVTPGGDVLDYPRGNFLMIVDLPANIQRLMEIRDMIDVQTFVGTRTEIYQPKIASADELQAEMTKVMQAYASSASQAEGFAAQFLSIPRINQLLIVADSESAWTYVKRWLERLDTIGEGPGRKIFLYPVENGKAVDLADVLTQVLGISSGQKRDRGPTLEQLHRGTSGAAPTTPGLQRSPGTGVGTFGGTSNMGSLQALAPAQPQQQAAPPPTAAQQRQQQPGRPGGPGGQPDQRQEEQLRVVADATTNTLIIFGTSQEFQNIKNILRELDIPPRQVVLECLVAEVQLTGSNSLGFNYQILSRANESFTDAFKRTPFTVGGGKGDAIAAGINALVGNDKVRGLIEALQGDTRSKILASPTILATDNQPARIQVGDEIPIATGSLTALNGGSTTDLATATTIQSRNTGKIMTIIPQVNAKGLVNLQIKVEISKQGDPVPVGNGGNFPSFATRDVETTAVVKDGESLIIAGIFSEDRSRTRSGIPFFMDIPVFGWFFRNTKETLGERTELIIIITPHVIRNLEESRRVTDEFRGKLSTVAGEIERMRRGAAKDDMSPPKLVDPERESRATPEIAPENSAASAPRGSGPERNSAAPISANVEAPPSPGAWKTVVKFLSFGLF
jgi:general secretion pathway protein D